ncbi:MAG: beta-N-acetylhexosaminidase [Candidatus Eiseniibacteriota bacterium]|nr:MAG: beta-N-acetylhexosaminidase [Candidatus Eisenbacteria bacterium]
MRNEIDTLLSSMSLKQKLGQLLVVGFEGTELTKELSDSLSKGNFAGFILFKRNIESSEGARRLLKGLRRLFPPDLPPILSLDEEGGRISQIDHLFSVSPSASRIGATRNTRFAFFHARDSAQKLKWLGFNVVFAPVLDVNDEPKNPVIGDRSFGADPGLVASLGGAALKGFNDGGIVPTAKHFPGHGSSLVDSHKNLPVISHPAERWYKFEFLPFTTAIEQGVRIVMMGHIGCPGLSGREDQPASFSPRVVEQILRKELGFQGVVITDALEMGAAAHYVASGGRLEEALLAGCDILLFAHGGENAGKALRNLLKAVKEGRLSEARVDESLRRILALRKHLL